MLNETKNWFGLALSSSTAVYCMRELPRRVSVPLINPAVACVESAVPTSQLLAQRQCKGSKDVLNLSCEVQLEQQFLLWNDHSHDSIPLCKAISKVKQLVLAVQSADLKTSTYFVQSIMNILKRASEGCNFAHQSYFIKALSQVHRAR